MNTLKIPLKQLSVGDNGLSVKLPVNEYPMLFSGPMVESIFEGRKTKTRRIIKLPKDFDGNKVYDNPAFGLKYTSTMHGGTVQRIAPRFQPGDRLWVRESLAKQLDGKYIFKADYPTGYKADFTATGNWKPSIHMPRLASRITLEVLDVRAERLQEISESDAIAEGIRPLFTKADINTPYYHPELDLNPMPWINYLWPKKAAFSSLGSAVGSYRSLWELINGSESWIENPWVWVITFKKV